MESLDGKVAWITGAGSGIGRACAVAFARAGARVALTGRRLPPLEETAVLTGAPVGDVVIAPADVSDAAAVAAAHAKIVAALGNPLVLVNSAGGNVKQRHWGNLAPASASEVIDLDLKAMLYCTLAVLPVMRACGDGRFVHIASKAGVEGLVRVLANELRGRQITVNAVAPGPVATELFLKGKTPAQIRAAIIRGDWRAVNLNPFMAAANPR